MDPHNFLPIAAALARALIYYFPDVQSWIIQNFPDTATLLDSYRLSNADPAGVRWILSLANSGSVTAPMDQDPMADTITDLISFAGPKILTWMGRRLRSLPEGSMKGPGVSTRTLYGRAWWHFLVIHRPQLTALLSTQQGGYALKDLLASPRGAAPAWTLDSFATPYVAALTADADAPCLADASAPATDDPKWLKLERFFESAGKKVESFGKAFRDINERQSMVDSWVDFVQVNEHAIVLYLPPFAADYQFDTGNVGSVQVNLDWNRTSEQQGRGLLLGLPCGHRQIYRIEPVQTIRQAEVW
jgi:hypothetical protein